MQRIGVFVCHCGTNIAGTVDVKKVAEQLGHEPGVVFYRLSIYVFRIRSEPDKERNKRIRTYRSGNMLMLAENARGDLP